ncbi:MAG: alpha/beta hydrolase [Deltaproteobacteria bacterium]|nr:alpha/beta hydrolase [Deltaproteobacteria bacterium]MBT6491509.1 alpha/beta hydrolase [Deltaproteobacteria bacterium]
MMKLKPFESRWFTPSGLSQRIQLRYGLFEPEGKPRGTLVLQGGRTEFIEKHAENIAELVARGFTVWSLDWRGQGLSTRPLADPHKGHIDEFTTYLTDFHQFMTDVVEPRTGRPDILMGHSMGGHILTRYLYRYPSAANRAILVAPMTRINTGPVPENAMYSIANNACRLGLSREYAASQTSHGPDQESFSRNRLTTDETRFNAAIAPIRDNPKLALGGITYGWLRAAILSMQKARPKAYLRRVLTPTLLVSPVNDRVVDPADHVKVARRLHDGTLHRIHGSEHEILHENDNVRASFWRAFDRFTEPALTR